MSAHRWRVLDEFGGQIQGGLTSKVAAMEKVLDSNKGSTPARSVVETLSESFTASAERAGQKPIQWKQVWNWFQNRRHSQKAKIARSPEKLKAVAGVADTSHSKLAAVIAPATLSGPGRKGNDGVQMEFEAKSARDGAWYDVSQFISHRSSAAGDPEVRVRFAGFGAEEDEWVNVRTAVRQRSLPCEASECVAVLPGDLILCFQEGNEQALYFDADILDVQRRRHDVRGCRCRFWVHYRHDQSEEVVPLRKVCRRPETEYRLQKLQSYGKTTGITDASQGGSQMDVETSPATLLSSASVSGEEDEANLFAPLSSAIPERVEGGLQLKQSSSDFVEVASARAHSGSIVNAAPLNTQVIPNVLPTTQVVTGGTAVEVLTQTSVHPEVSTRSVGSHVLGETPLETAHVPSETPIVKGDTATAHDVVRASEQLNLPSEQEKSVVGIEPSTVDSHSENIVVLDRVDIERLSRLKSLD